MLQLPSSALQRQTFGRPPTTRRSHRAASGAAIATTHIAVVRVLPQARDDTRLAPLPVTTRPNDAVLAAVRKARFKPHLHQSRAATGRAVVALAFELEA